jgi:hypothetical protein
MTAEESEAFAVAVKSCSGSDGEFILAMGAFGRDVVVDI